MACDRDRKFEIATGALVEQEIYLGEVLFRRPTRPYL